MPVYKRKPVNISPYIFLTHFCQPNKPAYFRLFDKSAKTYQNIKLNSFNEKSFYGLAINQLKPANESGQQVHFVVNGGGQRKTAIKRINCLWIDLDYADEYIQGIKHKRAKTEIDRLKDEGLNNLSQFPLECSFLIESKNGFHAYWLLADDERENAEIIAKFTTMQRAMVNSFKSDPKVIDLSRVMKLPGFYHTKDKNEPYMVKIIHYRPDLKYRCQDIIKQCDYDITDVKKIESDNKLYRASYYDKAVINKKSEVKQSAHIPENAVYIQYEAKEIECSSMHEFYKEARKIPLVDVIYRLQGKNLPLNTPFNCLFHQDKDPSAIISHKSGVFKYFCFGNCVVNDAGEDIFDLIKRILGINEADAIKWIEENYKIRHIDNEWTIGQKNKYIRNLSIIYNKAEYQSNKMKYPNLFRFLSRGKRFLVYELMQNFGLQWINESLQYNGASVFFASSRHLLHVTKVLKIDRKTLGSVLNEFCALGLLNKVPAELLPDYTLERAKKRLSKSDQKGINQFKMTSYYWIAEFSDCAREADRIACKLLDGRCHRKAISRKYIEALLGPDAANKIYPNGGSRLTESDRIMIKHLKKELSKNGYISNSHVYMKIEAKRENNKRIYLSPKEARSAFPVAIAHLVSEGYIQAIRANKKLKEEYLIKHKGYPIIYVLKSQMTA